MHLLYHKWLVLKLKWFLQQWWNCMVSCLGLKTRQRIKFPFHYCIPRHIIISTPSSFFWQHSQSGCHAQKHWLMEKVRMLLMAGFPLTIMSKTPGYFHSYFHTTKEFRSHSIPCLLTFFYTPQLETLQRTALILVYSHVATRLTCWWENNKKNWFHLNEKKFRSQRKEMLLFLSTSMAAVMSAANQQK